VAGSNSGAPLSYLKLVDLAFDVLEQPTCMFSYRGSDVMLQINLGREGKILKL